MPDKKKKAGAIRDQQISKLLEQEIAIILDSLNDARLNSLDIPHWPAPFNQTYGILVVTVPK